MRSRRAPAGRDLDLRAPWFVLAAGGFASGAIELDSHWVTHERVLGLPLARRARPRASRGSSASTSPSSRWRGSGSRSTASCAPQGAENVFVAGAALAGAAPWREGSGEGIALASGYRAAQMVLAAAGAPADRGMSARRPA